MRSLVLASLVGLLLGGAGAGGFVLMRERGASTPAPPSDRPVAADSTVATVADTALVDALPDSATLAALQAASLSDSLELTRQAASPTEEPAPDAAPDPDAGLPAPALDPERLAKLFANMPAKDAARALEQMDDTEIQVILGHLRDRQAAAILSSLPPQRVAGIGQAVLRRSRSAS